MAIYSKKDISPIQVKPPQGGTSRNQGQDQGQDQGQGQGQGQDQGQSEKSIDDRAAAIQEKMNQRREVSDEEYNKHIKSQSQSTTTDKNAKSDLKPIDTSKITPTRTWKQIISQFVGKPPEDTETTYLKQARRAATQIHQAGQGRSYAIKPGERPAETVYKLMMVFDTSQSMADVIGKALVETSNLLKSHKPSFDPIVGITFFSNIPIFYAVNLKTENGWRIDKISDLLKPPTGTQEMIPLKSILTLSQGGGTTFSNELGSQLSGAARAGYNIIVFSDDDILWPENWPSFLTFYTSSSRQVFFIARTAEIFGGIIKKLGGIKPDTFGHM